MKKFVLLFAFGLFLISGCFVFSSCGSKNGGLTRYIISARYDDQSQTLLCNENVIYQNSSENALSEVCFFLYANSFDQGQKSVPTSYLDKAYPNGQSFGNLGILGVRQDEGDLEYAVSENKNILTIFLTESLYPNEVVELCIDFQINLANINHRLGYGKNATNFGNFFPIVCVYEDGFVKNEFSPSGDPFFSESSNFEVNFSCPSEYVVASSGKQECTTEENGVKTIKIVGENIRDFAIVVSKNFEVLQKQADGTMLNYFFYNDENAEKHLKLVEEAFLTFSKNFCKYPYSQLSVVKTNFCFGGMEYPNLVMISDDLVDEQMISYVTTHEIAHQWWYSLVGNNQFSESWIDEGLTEFSTAFFFEKNPSYGLKYDEIISGAVEHYKKFVEIYSDILGEPVNQTMTRNLKEFNTEPEYVCNIYTKGLLLFDALRKSMNDFKFFRCLKNYADEFKYKIVSKEDVIESFSKSSHRNLENFFNSWLDGRVIIK